MLSVEAAQTIVLENSPTGEPTPVTIADVLDLVLAEEVRADIDMPPFPKSMMDGYAIRAADLVHGRAHLQVVGEISAGQSFSGKVEPGTAVQIMTGAPIPEGADAVVMLEQARPGAKGFVELEESGVAPGKNILPQGMEMKCGDVVLERGTILGAAHIGLLATVGRTAVLAFPQARLAVIATGDELIEPPQKPAMGQIRNGNGPMLLAQARRGGAIALNLGIARDDRNHLAECIERGLQSDILLLSGGVSAGKKDLVPEVLSNAGVTTHFHKVAMKPGKPILFGTRAGKLVFGLPGNPVSSFVCFELFVRPAMRRFAGQLHCLPEFVQAKMAEDFTHRSDRPTYHPARLVETSKGRQVRTSGWFGSADLRGLTQANALVRLPAGDLQLTAGQSISVLSLLG